MNKMKKQKPKSSQNRNNLRKHQHMFMLNDAEDKILNRYLDTYKIDNKSKFIRETLMYAILKKFDEDAPTLFD